MRRDLRQRASVRGSAAANNAGSHRLEGAILREAAVKQWLGAAAAAHLDAEACSYERRTERGMAERRHEHGRPARQGVAHCRMVEAQSKVASSAAKLLKLQTGSVRSGE